VRNEGGEIEGACVFHEAYIVDGMLWMYGMYDLGSKRVVLLERVCIAGHCDNECTIHDVYDSIKST
jgi:hypothetical protein